MTRYEQGFMNKCAEYGVDGTELLNAVLMNKQAQAISIGSALKNGLKAMLNPQRLNVAGRTFTGSKAVGVGNRLAKRLDSLSPKARKLLTGKLLKDQYVRSGNTPAYFVNKVKKLGLTESPRRLARLTKDIHSANTGTVFSDLMDQLNKTTLRPGYRL